jgi:1-acyl-sn-glycerol-3-phosphate acyltransferase
MIKTIFVFAYIIVAVMFLMPFGIIATVFYFLGLKKLMIMVVYRLAQIWAITTIALTGSNVVITGKENIPKKGSVCFVSNHCGYFDIMLLLAYCNRPFGFVAKKELLLLPFFNAWIFMLGGLFIDRKSVRKAIKTINKGVVKIKKGGGMLIFPEGHRSKGRGLLPFHSGSLKLATMANAPIVPVAIEGSYEVFEKTGWICKSNIKLTFCDVIKTEDLTQEEKKQALCDRIYASIKAQMAE